MDDTFTRSDTDGESTGFIHSFETLGALDGPGLRLVVFLQGCALRCRYCHNPDTWQAGPAGGQRMLVEEIVRRAQRMKPYFGRSGGVTLSGGDPLAQPGFVLALLAALKKAGIATALDTSGSIELPADSLSAILEQTDLVLLDIKHPDPYAFQWLTSRSIEPLLDFLQICSRMGKEIWLRQVIVPGWNDTEADLARLVRMVAGYPGLRIRRWQLLPYHTLGLTKYQQMGLSCPLGAVPPMPADKLADLQEALDRLVSIEVKD